MAVGYLTWVVLDQLDILQVRQLAVNETVDWSPTKEVTDDVPVRSPRRGGNTVALSWRTKTRGCWLQWAISIKESWLSFTGRTLFETLNAESWRFMTGAAKDYELATHSNLNTKVVTDYSKTEWRLPVKRNRLALKPLLTKDAGSIRANPDMSGILWWHTQCMRGYAMQKHRAYAKALPWCFTELLNETDKPKRVNCRSVWRWLIIIRDVYTNCRNI